MVRRSRIVVMAAAAVGATERQPLLEMQQEEEQDGGVEDGIEDPSPDPVAPTFEDVKEKDPEVAHEVARQRRDLAVHDEREPRRPHPDLRPEPVPVHDGVDERGGQDREHLERLGEFEPQKGHADEDALVEELEGIDPAVAEDGEEGAEQVEEAGEVEGVGPEEHAAHGARAEREAEEPLEGGRFSPPPDPPRVLDLGGGGG